MYAASDFDQRGGDLYLANYSHPNASGCDPTQRCFATTLKRFRITKQGYAVFFVIFQ